MAKLILADVWLKQLCEAQGINYKRTSRIIIDAKAGEPIYMYVSQFGDSDLLTLAPPEVIQPKVTQRPSVTVVST